MTLGQRISVYRKEKGYSQEDLANLLNISRQSVYKWESDISTPELDKLVALSNIFDVSLDELIKGNKLQNEDKNENISKQIITNDKHTIIGAIFLGLGVLVSVIMSLLYGLLFIAIGLVCLIAKKYVGLMCAWVSYIWFVLYMIMATGINASMIRLTFQWSSDMNYMRLIFAWIMFILMIVMIFVTVRAMIKNSQQNDKDVIVIVACAVLFLVIRFFPLGKIIMNIPSKDINSSFAFWFNFITASLSIIKTWLVIIFLGKLIPVIKTKVNKNKV